MGRLDLVRVSRLYGASPLHLLAHLALLPLCAWALLEVLGGRAAGNVAVWLIASVVIVDLVVLPLYSGLDWAGRRVFGGAINYVRIPVALSLLMLVVFWGTIGERGEGAYRAASGLEYSGYAQRWLLASAVLFAASAVLYLLRRRGDHDESRR
jgi:hypothetical protein